MLKGIIFDFDGTLAETNTLILEAMKRTFMELFGNYSDEQLMNCIGPPLVATGIAWYPQDPQFFVDTYRKHQLELHDDMITAYPSVIEMLDKLHKMDLKLAIVTSKKRDVFLKGLHKLDMEKYFDATVAEDDVTNHKPDPESMNLVLSQLGLSADECMMIGDNYHDILAARAVEMKSVAVGWAIKGLDYLKEYNPDFIMHDSFDIFEIIENFNSSF